MRFSLSPGPKTIGSITVAGVLVVGLTDWLQGATPDGVIDVGDGTGLALFGLCSIGVAVGALVATERGVDEPVVGHWAIVMALATLASMLADPTYAVLLFAVPLVHIARRWPEPLRNRTIVTIFVLAAVLISLEDQPNANNWPANSTTASATACSPRRSSSATHERCGTPTRPAHSVRSSSQPRVDDALVDTRIAVDAIRSRSGPFSLTAALPELLDRMTSPALGVELMLDGPVDSVEQLAQITLYRVAQEALTNVVRHADASTVTVHHTASRVEAILVVADDGKGYDVDADAVHLGLRGLEERLQRVDGRLEVTSSHCQGTTLTATIGRLS